MSNVLKLAKVMQITALSRSSIYSFMEKGSFPAAIKLGPRSVGWLEQEIREWLADRVEARNKFNTAIQ